MLCREKILENLEKKIPNFSEKKFLLAVSGGVDSMTLLSIFLDIFKEKKNLFVAHINYHLRGEDSLNDQKLVENFCNQNHIPYFIQSIKKTKPTGSIQIWAREIRYQFFKEILEKNKINFLVTAHHLEDQWETFLINLSRGTGIGGLGGISEKNQIIRPLLSFTKAEIYHFAQENKIPYREDKSNQKNDYLRNQIRNEISPKIQNLNPEFWQNFKKTLSYINESKNFINEKINQILSEISIQKEENLLLDKEKLSLQSDFVKFEILKKYDFKSQKEIKKIFQAKVGRFFHSNLYTLYIDRKFITINPKNLENLEKKDEIWLPNKDKIDLEKFLGKENFPQNFCWNIDKDKIKFPLKIRKKKDGDFFYPIGMKGKKKISKYLKDEKIPLYEKHKIWLLSDDDENILGILPFRQDKRFFSEEKTKKTIKIYFHKK